MALNWPTQQNAVHQVHHVVDGVDESYDFNELSESK